MKSLFVILFSFASATLLAQSLEFYYDGTFHYSLDGNDINPEGKATIVGTDIYLEHNALIYAIEHYESCTDQNQKCEAVLIGDRSKIARHGWAIDFYIKKGDYLIAHIAGEFVGLTDIFSSGDGNIFSLYNGSYLRLNNYKTTPQNTVEDLVVLEDGIWYQDAENNLYILRDGLDFEGEILETFKKGYTAYDSKAGEYIWLNYVTDELTANTMNYIDVLPEVCAINVSSGSYPIYIPLYNGAKFSSNTESQDFDEAGAHFFFDPKLNKAFMGYGRTRTLELEEIEIPEGSNRNWWILGKNREAVLITDGEIYGSYDHYNHYQGEWAMDDYKNSDSYVLYPAKKLN